MHTGNNQPFIDSRAFNKANTAYVPFPSQADAMLASLQLFHDVPCRIMDLIFSVVTHPDFDSKQVTLRNSIDVIDVVEGSRLKDRMAFVHERSVSRDGCTRQAGFPHFVLHEVLEIFHAERMDSVRAYFESTLNNKEMYRIMMRVEEDRVLKTMSLVHRTWTLPVQKTFGRILYIGRPQTYCPPDLLHPVRKSIFGSWTSVVAVQLYHPMEETMNTEDHYEYSPISTIRCEYRQWLETLHRILVSFTNLKIVLVQSYAPYFTEWFNSTVGELLRRNMYLEEVALYSTRNEGTFILDPLIENPRISENLTALRIQGVKVSDVPQRQVAMQGTDFARLSNLTIKRSLRSLKEDYAMISILSTQSSPCLKSLCIIYDLNRRGDPERDYDSDGEDDSEREGAEREESFEEDIERAFTASQCATIFKSLCALHIDGKGSTDQWFKWIVPYCLNLESLSVVDSIYREDSFEQDIARTLTSSQCAAIFEHLCSLRLVCKSADKWVEWIGPYCSNLKSCTLETDVSLPSAVLPFISSTIQNLDLQFMTTKWTEFEEITDWTKCLLEVPSSGHFSELKSFKLVISEDCLIYWQRSRCSRAEELTDEMRRFRKEVTTAFRGSGIECDLSLPLKGLL